MLQTAMAGVLAFIMVTEVGADGNTAEIKATGVTKNDNTAKM